MTMPALPAEPPPQLIALLPSSVKELIAIGGLTATIKLVNKYSGRRVIFRTLVKNETDISLIGKEALQAYSHCYGSELIPIPNCHEARSWLKNQALFDDMRLGLSGSQLAQKYDLTERHISNLRKRYNRERINPLPNQALTA